MRKIWVVLGLFVLLGNSISVFAAEPDATVTYEPKTGDVEFDAILGDLNIEATANLSVFMAELSASHQVSQETVGVWLGELQMTPADAYMTATVAQTSKQPVDAVVKQYKANKGKGWGVIAQRMGIKPGSEEFHALKSGGATELVKIKAKAAKTKTTKEKTVESGASKGKAAESGAAKGKKEDKSDKSSPKKNPKKK